MRVSVYFDSKAKCEVSMWIFRTQFFPAISRLITSINKFTYFFIFDDFFENKLKVGQPEEMFFYRVKFV